MKLRIERTAVVLPPLPCRVERILQLRRDVFFPGQSIQQARYPGDHEPEAAHFAGVIRYDHDLAEHLVACVSMHVSEYDGEPAWRARGLAVDPAYRKLGIGQAFFQACCRRMCADSPMHVIWCSAKPESYGFFERLGWRMADEIYLMQGTGTHFQRVD